MKKISTLLLLYFVLFSPVKSLQAQEVPKFGKIPDEWVFNKTYEKDPSAEAVVYAHSGDVKINFNSGSGFQAIYRVYRVVKVLTKEGFGHADLDIPYYVIPARLDNVGNIKGFVYNESDGKIVKTKLEKSHIFDEEVSKTYHKKKVAPPNVKEGSVIEISYEITSDLLGFIRDWEFQSSIPTVWSEFTFEYPEYFSYSQANQGFVKYHTSKRTKGSGNASWSDINRQSQGYAVSSQISSNSVSYTTEKIHYAVKNAPALRNEPYADNAMSYATRVEYQLQYIDFPNSQRQHVASSWTKVSEDLIKDPDFGKYISSNKFSKELSASIVKDLTEPNEKAEAIYKHITKSVVYNGERGIYPSKSIEKTYKEGKGSLAEINFLLIQLLRDSGIEAHPVIGTSRDVGFLNPSNPIMYKLNYVMALAVLPEKEILIDASDASLPFGFLPINAINHSAWAVIPDNGSRWVEVTNASMCHDITLVNARIEEDKIHITSDRTLEGYHGASLKKIIYLNGEESLALEYRDKLKNWEVKSSQWESKTFDERKIVEKLVYVGSDGLMVNQDMIYISPFAEGELSDNPFKQEKRIFPIDFVYSQRKQTIFTIEIPEGFQVDEMPKPSISHFKDKDISYIYRIANQGDKIQIMVNYIVNRTMFKPEEFDDLKTYFDLIAEKQKESIVLKKI